MRISPIRTLTFLGGLAFLSLFAGCEGHVGNPGSPAGTPAGSGGSGMPGGGGTGSIATGIGTVPIVETGQAAISRLTVPQFLNSAAVLMGDAAVVGAEDMFTLREDWTGPAYSNAGFNQATGKHNIQDFDAAATYIVGKVTSWPAFHARWGGCTQVSCVNTFIGNFTEAAFRRPPTDAEIAAFKPILDASAAAVLTYDETVQLLVRATLQSAEFLYFFQDEKLNDFQLASRLSYFVTDGPPDAELYAAAKSQLLHTPDVLNKQVDRLLAGDMSGFARAFARDYFELNVTFLRSGDRATQRQLVSSATDSFSALVQQKKTVDSILTTDSLVVNDATSAWLELPPLTTTAKPSDGYPFMGLLTHPAVLMAISNENTGSTISRGLALSEQFLCVAPPPNPPDGIQLKQNDFNLPPDATARTQAEARMMSGLCVGCHSRFEPFSFALNHWGGDGRYNTDPRLNDNGPITTVLGTIDFANYKDFLQSVAVSQQFRNCTSEQLIRYGLQHTTFPEDLRTTVMDAASMGSGGITFQSLIKALVQQPIFSQR